MEAFFVDILGAVDFGFISSGSIEEANMYIVNLGCTMYRVKNRCLSLHQRCGLYEQEFCVY